MDAEALIGTVLGTCRLQRLIGQGGMGSVFLAHQSHPSRQVAVKVLLPLAHLAPHQHAAFSERFRRETNATALLKHPHIVSVHESGEQEGLAYLVMPYIDGGTLRDQLEREGQLPLQQVATYLDQLASALDFAHGRGIIHRDIKPANILISSEGRLLLADFGLVKVLPEGQVPQVRLTKAGVPVGTPEYMAPEQVMGGEIDARSDLYSLGIVLYHMVTGQTPFQGGMPMQIAMQHLHASPQPPSMLRANLPAAVEQVILRALAKQPSERYAQAQDLANAFCLAVTVTDSQLDVQSESVAIGNTSTMKVLTPHHTSAPAWPTGMMSTISSNLPSPTVRNTPVPNLLSVLPSTITMEDFKVPDITQETSTTMKLTQSMKVVRVPIAGQPGRYVTGLLPTMETTQETVVPPQWDETTKNIKSILKKHDKSILLVGVLFLILIDGIFWFAHMHYNQNTNTSKVATPDLAATAQVEATTTAEANIILTDSLAENKHNWPVSNNGVKTSIFKDGAYHITDTDTQATAIALLPDKVLTGAFVYTLSMEEIKGDDTSVNNQFGMLLRFSTTHKNGATATTFYLFEVSNTKGGDYEFLKYDDSYGPSVSPWTTLWSGPFNHEFHYGHGVGTKNTLTVAMQGSNFIFTVNSKRVGKIQDNALSSGQIGMLVNRQNTEVAFSDLLLTYK